MSLVELISDTAVVKKGRKPTMVGRKAGGLKPGPNPDPGTGLHLLKY